MNFEDEKAVPVEGLGTRDYTCKMLCSELVLFPDASTCVYAGHCANPRPRVLKFKFTCKLLHGISVDIVKIYELCSKDIRITNRDTS